MPDLKIRFNKDMLVVAPLLTLGLLDEEMDGSENLEYFCILDEDLVRETHLRFRAAGAECVLTNTLQANAQALHAFGLEDALQDINRAGVRLAREAGFEHVLAAVQVVKADLLSEQVAALLPESPDAFFLAGAADNAEFALAVQAIRLQTHLPIIAAVSVVDDLDTLEGLVVSGADIICHAGLNLNDSIQVLSLGTMQDCSQPRMICPNPGKPQGRNERQLKMAQNKLIDEMIDFALEARDLGVQFIGTAPGSSPVFTGAISAAIRGLDVVV